MIYLNNNTQQQLVSIPRTTVLTDSAVTQFATEEYVDEAIEEALEGFTGGTTYSAGANIDITNDTISVSGITSYTGVTSQEIITALGYTPAKVTAVTEQYYNNLQTKDPNTIYGIIE